MPSLELLDRARLLVVTGKGGTGKTTVAAALALAAGLRGRRTLVVEVEGRQGLARLFGRRFLDHQERRVAERVSGLAVDPEASLREYLGRYGFAPLARLLTWARLTHFITAAAPGLGDVLLVGKVWEASTRGQGGYDLVVLDAPPTGRVVPFLRAPQTVAELARVGPIRHQAERVRELLDDPERTGIVLACLPEELPVAETLEGVASLRAAALPVASVVANRVTDDRLGGRAGRLAALARDPAPLAEAARRAGAELDGRSLAVLLAEARDRQRQVARERRLLRELRAGVGELPVVELPFLAGGIGGPGEVRALAGRLGEVPEDAREPRSDAVGPAGGAARAGAGA
jgi:anion-transporting  ArsA/GET3 family ATPase